MSSPSIRLTREELYQQVWAEPMIHVARRLGLSDRGLGKVCARHAIPVPPRGWWARKRHGQAVRQTPLKASDSPTGPIVIRGAGTLEATPAVQPEISRESDPAWKIVVPDDMLITHPLVRATGVHIRRGWKNGASVPVAAGTPQTRAPEAPAETLTTSVSRSVLPRALRIWQALLSAFDRRGYAVTFDKNGATVVSVLGEPFEIAVVERRRRVFVDGKWGRSMELEPSGLLFLRVGGNYSSSGTAEGPPHFVEEQLNRFVASLVRRALEIQRQRAAREERERRWQIHDDRRRHKQQERDTERLRVHRMRVLALRWSQDRRLADFLADVERRLSRDPDGNRREADATLLAWAHEHLRSRDLVARFLEDPWPIAPLPPAQAMPWSWE